VGEVGTRQHIERLGYEGIAAGGGNTERFVDDVCPELGTSRAQRPFIDVYEMLAHATSMDRVVPAYLERQVATPMIKY
jgi:hypothetical protein